MSGFLPKKRFRRKVLKQAVTCLTEPKTVRHYSLLTNTNYDYPSMSKKQVNSKSPVEALKSESARQRWELFHRAIAHAKESNAASMDETDTHVGDAESTGPLLTIVR